MPVTDEERFAAARAYIAALASHDADAVPFAPGCVRIEVGIKTGFSGNHLRRSLNRGLQYKVIKATEISELTATGDVVHAKFDVITKAAVGGRRVAARVDETFLIPVADGKIYHIRASIQPFVQSEDPSMPKTPRPLNAKQVERLNAPFTGTAIKWMSKAQTWIFKRSNGKLGNKFLRGSEVGILTTIGRKSGEPRDSPLLFLQEGQRIVLVASQGGRANNPMWYLNLVANPRVTFQSKGGTSQLVARDATDAERDEYWPKLDAMYPDFANYRSYTDRKIPIVICDP